MAHHQPTEAIMTRVPLLAAALLLAALPAVAQQSLVGSWQSTEEDIVMTFADDGTYLMQPPGGRSPTHGKWTMADNVVSFTNDPGSERCDGVTGTWSLLPQSEGSIAFVLVEDDCRPREKFLPLPWTPVQ